MRRNIKAIFAILALIILILCSACILQPSVNQTPQQDGGLAQVSVPVESPYIIFDVAQRNLPAYRSESIYDTASSDIYYITGIDINESGAARSWIFGVRGTNGTEMLAYDRSGWTTLPWNAPLYLEEISIDSIVSPARLFSQNTAVVIGNPPPTIPERRDLELKQGIYTLTITSGSTTRILTFNATTGELITKP
ncbi:MAG: hypothetical protein WC294_05210 [Methanoregula sp.]|jgi:hypothetical protein